MRIDPAYREALHECGLDTVDSSCAASPAAWSPEPHDRYVASTCARDARLFIKRHFYSLWRAKIAVCFIKDVFGASRTGRVSSLV